MLQGALIGLIVGIIMAFVAMQQRRGLLKDVLAALGRGGPTALTVLNGKVRPIDRLRVSHIDKQRQRMACLAIIGDVETLERELAQHTGDLTAVAQVDAIGHLGIAIRSDGERQSLAIAGLDALATRMERDGGRLLGLVKKKTRALASLAGAVAGQPMRPEHKIEVENMAREKSSPGLIVAQALGMALSRLGRADLAEPHLARVRAETTAFEVRPAA